jgi:eukaryotic-like serine/threonine-protein kinase
MPEDSSCPSSVVPGTAKTSRWTDVKALFELALTLDSTEWSSFLDVQCAGDQELFQEVESLLQAHESDEDFLEQPIASVKAFAAAESVPKPASPGPGDRIGAYQLEREIGRGGMGFVYLANRADQEFDKQVAIKLIRVEKETEYTLRRFRQERQILATLEHPYIARLLDGGTIEPGMPYLVMEYVEGESLTQFCDSRALANSNRLELFLKACSAVQYAHEHSVIHRDLKPSNILVERNGTPKLLDFGIAKLLEDEDDGAGGSKRDVTVAGMRVLTPAYASPEQLHGEPATVQSDVYSLGVILYELLCGSRPSFKTLHASSSRHGEREEHLSPNLRAIVFNSMRPDPSERYESVSSLMTDIERYLKGAPTALNAPFSEESRERISIGVLPFRELGTDSNADPFLRSAVTDALITRLSKVERFSVRPTTAVLKYSHAASATQAARELRVRYLVEGTFHTVKERVRLNVQLVSAETGLAEWAAQFEEQSGDLLRLEDSISEQIAFALIPQLTREEQLSLSRAGTANGHAHEAYLRGRYHWSRSAGEPEELSKALVCFMQAIAEDPNYARAHAGVADYYLRLGLWGGTPPAESFAAGIAAARKALELEPDLADAHASLGFCLWAHDHAYAAAEREFNYAIARNPDSANAHHWFGLLNSARNRSELALANLDRAHKIDPNSPVIAAALGFVHYNAGQYARALELLCAAAQERRKSAVIQEMLAWCYLQMNETAKALDCARRALDLSGRSPASLAVLARAQAAAGLHESIPEISDELNKMQAHRYVSGYDRASVSLALQDVPGALKSLREANAARDWWTCWLGVDPRWNELRADSRFAELVASTQPIEDSRAAEPGTWTRPSPKRRWILPTAAVAAILLCAVLGSWLLLRQQKTPFINPEFARLTGDGTAGVAAISPDGNYIAYTTAKRGHSNVWKRKVGSTVSVPLLSALPGVVSNLQFTRNGDRVAVEVHPVLQENDRRLLSVPLAGGQPETIADHSPGPVSMSPDGTEAVTFRANRTLNRDELWLLNIGTKRERILASWRYPARFVWLAPPAWSPDAKMIVFAVQGIDKNGPEMSIHVVDVRSGKTSRVSSPRWIWVEHLAWVHGTEGLAIVGRLRGSSFRQLWYIGYPDGPFRRLGNDIESYSGASAPNSGSAIVSVQLQTLANVYVGTLNDPSHPVQITPGTGRYFDLTWTPDGRILYASDSTGEPNIWSMNADGGEARQLTSGAGLNWGPAASPDGRYIAFHSNRSGNWNIWRADADGGNPFQLTSGTAESRWPHFTSDAQTLLFHRTGPDGMWNIWSVPVLGGMAQRLTSKMTTHPTVSPKDGSIAAWYSETVDAPQWKLAIFKPQGGNPVKLFTPEVAITPDSKIAWSPRGDAITCLGQQQDGTWNLWMQPIDGRKAWQLTSFRSGQIYSFDWSKDAKLVLSQGVTTSDVIVMRDKRRGNWND